MNAPRKVLPLAQFCLRNFTTSSRKQANEEIPKRILRLRENQKRFGLDDGTPVYLKGGLKDKLLFQFTVGLVIVGLGMTGEFFYTMIKK